MAELDRQMFCDFVNTEIVKFHQARLARLTKMKLSDVLKTKNPYLFKAKYGDSVGAIVHDLLNSYLSSLDEELLGNYVKGLAVFVSQRVEEDRKTAAGLDSEGVRDSRGLLPSANSSIKRPSDGLRYAALDNDLKRVVQNAKLVDLVGQVMKWDDEADNERMAVRNRLFAEFVHAFCNDDYSINWQKVVELTCLNIRS